MTPSTTTCKTCKAVVYERVDNIAVIAGVKVKFPQLNRRGQRIPIECKCGQVNYFEVQRKGVGLRA